MHISNAIKSLVVIFVQCEVVFGLQVFRCEFEKSVALCRRATALGEYNVATEYGLMRAMQAGPTATCEEFTIQGQPIENGACCPHDFGVSVNYGDDTFVKTSAQEFDKQCTAPPTAVPT
ncbi:hypothetical protein PtA15_14A337 [Puccinia triticina]|uniref:Uncharacterized protein n=1 Tax=Puccinia triticina TaxID=208348 RepID=A0ABY7D4D0_9BASI|nr:uncharacterized protein PtA15_14A337 [Puccinia triticina]WAQ91453.1 hypothetical protein PtA15_14A337 [Puccinia triticina]